MRGQVLLIPVIGAVAFGALTIMVGGAKGERVPAQHAGATSTSAADADVLLLASAPPSGLSDRDAAAISSIRRVTSTSELARRTGPQTLIVIDASAFATVDPAFLRQRLASGVPIVALNLPRTELEDATGYNDAAPVRHLNDVAREQGMTGPPSQPPPAEPYYSFVFVIEHARAGCDWEGNGQREFRDSLFRADLRNLALLAHGLTEREGGGVVSLDSLCGGG